MNKYSKETLPDAFTEDQLKVFTDKLATLCEEHNVFLYANRNNVLAVLCVNGGIDRLKGVSFKSVVVS